MDDLDTHHPVRHVHGWNTHIHDLTDAIDHIGENGAVTEIQFRFSFFQSVVLQRLTSESTSNNLIEQLENPTNGQVLRIHQQVGLPQSSRDGSVALEHAGLAIFHIQRAHLIV